MPAFQHILVATDFGSSSDRAVRLAAELATRFTARLTVLHVLQHIPPVFPDVPVAVPVLAREEREREAKRELDAFLASLGREAPLCEGLLRFGDPAREIVAHAEESACDLVVVGTHGRRRLSRLLLGSVAEKVVRTSHVPVLTVRAEQPTKEAHVAGQASPPSR
jgi:nucleotide-binding universal stress UspA family protein